MLEVLLGLAHQFDHPLVTLPRRGTEAENAVLEQHDPLELAPIGGAGQLPHLLGQDEARHHVRHHQHPVAIHFANPAAAVRRVADCDHRIGMGVIDEREGDDGVEDRFDRRGGRAGIGHRGALRPHHVAVAQLGQLRHTAQWFEQDGREAGGLDGREIPAAALDVEQLLRVAEEISRGGLDRRVAAAVQHQRRLEPQQVRGVDPEIERSSAAVGFGIVPAAQHACLWLWRPPPIYPPTAVPVRVYRV